MRSMFKTTALTCNARLHPVARTGERVSCLKD